MKAPSSLQEYLEKYYRYEFSIILYTQADGYHMVMLDFGDEEVSLTLTEYNGSYMIVSASDDEQPTFRSLEEEMAYNGVSWNDFI